MGELEILVFQGLLRFLKEVPPSPSAIVLESALRPSIEG